MSDISQPHPEERTPEQNFEPELRHRIRAVTSQCVSAIRSVQGKADAARLAIVTTSNALSEVLCDAVLECPDRVGEQDMASMEEKRKYLIALFQDEIARANLAQFISLTDIERNAFYMLAHTARRQRFTIKAQNEAINHQDSTIQDLQKQSRAALGRLDEGTGEMKTK